MITPAATQPEVLRFSAPVTGVEGCRVHLAESYFYPAGGGQPADRGRIDGLGVVDVIAEVGAIVHGRAELPPSAGAAL